MTVGAERREEKKKDEEEGEEAAERARQGEKRGMDVVCWWGRAADRIVQMRHFDEWAEFGASGSTIKRTKKKS